MPRFEFDFGSPLSAPLRLALIGPWTSSVRIEHGILDVRFGLLRLRTPVSNIEDASVTGPYNPLKALGVHVSLTDRGLTFGTGFRRGVCIRFRRPVSGVLPVPLLSHPGLTVTVVDPDRLVDELLHERDAARAEADRLVATVRRRPTATVSPIRTPPVVRTPPVRTPQTGTPRTGTPRTGTPRATTATPADMPGAPGPARTRRPARKVTPGSPSAAPADGTSPTDGTSPADGTAPASGPETPAVASAESGPQARAAAVSQRVATTARRPRTAKKAADPAGRELAARRLAGNLPDTPPAPDGEDTPVAEVRDGQATPAADVRHGEGTPAVDVREADGQSPTTS